MMLHSFKNQKSFISGRIKPFTLILLLDTLRFSWKFIHIFRRFIIYFKMPKICINATVKKSSGKCKPYRNEVILQRSAVNL